MSEESTKQLPRWVGYFPVFGDPSLLSSKAATVEFVKEDALRRCNGGFPVFGDPSLLSSKAATVEFVKEDEQR